MQVDRIDVSRIQMAAIQRVGRDLAGCGLILQQKSFLSCLRSLYPMGFQSRLNRQGKQAVGLDSFLSKKDVALKLKLNSSFDAERAKGDFGGVPIVCQWTGGPAMNTCRGLIYLMKC